MEGKENIGFDVESPPEETTSEINDENVDKSNISNALNNGNNGDAQIELQKKKKRKVPKNLSKAWKSVRVVLTGKRVAHALIVMYFIGALLHWFVFKRSELQWNICEDQGLVLVQLFFYLCYVLCYFGNYVSKVTIVIKPIYKLSVKILGPLMTKVVIYGLQVAALSAYLIWDIWDDFARWRSIIGVFKNLFVLWIFSSYKRKINWEVPIRALLFQFYICLLMLRVPFMNDFITCIAEKFTAFLDFSKGGGSMVFGEELANSVFAFTVMPVILFLSFVVAILNHLNILPKFIFALGKALLWIIGTQSEVEAFTSASSIFIGQIEAPILIQPYLSKLTRSEMFTIMVSGLSTIAGAVMAAYIQFGFSAVHMISASIMSAIGAIGACKLFMPDTQPTETKDMELFDQRQKANIFDITSTSAASAFEVIKSVISSLIIWLSAIPFANTVIANCIYLLCGLENITFEYMLGILFTPFAYLMGTDWNDSLKVGKLIGIKIIINEFVAYTELKELEGIISQRSTTVATYALCGFSNFGALATMVSTLKVMAPSKAKDITKNAYWALLVANVVCDMTACIAGALTP